MTDIIIAYGCEIRDTGNERDVVAYLNANADSAGTGKWTYPKGAKTHTVRLVYTKSEFAAALDKSGAVVVYDGHSRIGQGPVFGPARTPTCPGITAFPTNPWDDNFRMGWDFAAIDCIGDIMHHGINPAEFRLPTSVKGVFASKGLLKIVEDAIAAKSTRCGTPKAWRSLSACFPREAARVNCRGGSPLAGRHYYRARKGGTDFDTLVKVGDADLKKQKLACAVLFMNSCSSKRHFLGALRRRKAAAKSKCMFYVTGDSCSANTTLLFLKAVLAGTDVSKQSKAILKVMNGLAGSGFISLEK
ncbi:hypothetical protein [uncultured Sphingomonas sp.]|uniref:hypothetical protein n=1 Tax=uncultured Sphingomonas sp. TaxID=158754 RepID=UPI0025E92B0D|nr:hypothetical protein [uncultured Sphingomonas sp.]